MSDPRNVYLASSFDLAERVESVCRQLESVGHNVPDQWWRDDLKRIDLPDDEWYQHDPVQNIADQHWQSIEQCDTFVLVCPPDGAKKYNGANVEFGYAHANGLDCYAVGELERSAMYVPIERVGTVSDLLEVLSQ